MTSAFTNAISRGFRALFGPRIKMTKTYTSRPMTEAEREAFDKVFAEMDKAFKILRGDG